MKKKILFLKIFKFLRRQINKIKFKLIITKNKSGINGPDIRDKGIKNNKKVEKLIILF